VKAAFLSLLRYLDGRAIVHIISVHSTLMITWGAMRWAEMFAYTGGTDLVGKAAIIAAVLAPLATLQGYVLKNYGDNRGAPNDGPDDHTK
jgi:hypothetical protein